MFAFYEILCYTIRIPTEKAANTNTDHEDSMIERHRLLIYANLQRGTQISQKTIANGKDRDFTMAQGKITVKQQQILDYIKDEILKRGYPPAVREICEAVNLKSTSSVHSHLETLEKNGYIRRDPTKPRAIEICDDNFQMVRTEMVSLPVIGQVAAGQPILAEQNIDSYFPVPADMVPSGESFVLKVKGDSMINVGIYSGDQIFVNCCQTASNGDTVVALIDDSATVKTFYREDGHVRLQPENDSMDPIIVDDCQILGKVFGVFRLYRR